MKVTISNYLEVELGDDDTSKKLRQLSAEENKPLGQTLKDEIFVFLKNDAANRRDIFSHKVCPTRSSKHAKPRRKR